MAVLLCPDATVRRIATIGMFDGVHLGHRFLLDFIKGEARARGLRAMAVTFASHPLATLCPEKAPHLLEMPEQRYADLQQAGFDDVLPLDFTQALSRLSARDFMNLLHRDYGVTVLVTGFNNRFGHNRAENVDDYRRFGTEIGMEVLVAPEYPNEGGSPISSSAIRTMLSAGDVVGATKALGRPYSLTGMVVSGRQIGRELGFPTANIKPSIDLLLVPAIGVYACRVVTSDGEVHNAMVNIGHRPTIEAHGATSIEAHIFDFDHNIYATDITVQFIARMRGERQFASLAALTEQLSADARQAQIMLGSD